MIPDRRPARPGYSSNADERRTLYGFVGLSLLLHALVIAFFGSAAGGGAQRGDETWGTLDVTLRRMTSEPGAGLRLAPGAETTSPGTAFLRRRGSATATPEAPPAEAPVPASTPNVPALERMPLPLH